jgi:hypothetical protein
MEPEPVAQAPSVEEPPPQEEESMEHAPEPAVADSEGHIAYWETPAETPSHDFAPTAEETEAAPAADVHAEAEQWHPEETAEDTHAVESAAAPEPAAEFAEDAAATVPAEADDYHPGYDADAFGYHGAEYPEEEAPQAYRYEWPTSEAAPEETPEAAAPAGEYEPSPAEYEPSPAAAEYEPAPAHDSWRGISMEEMNESPEHVEPLVPQPAASSDQAQSGSHAGSSSQPAVEAASRFVTEELAGILTAAEESATRIVERARETSERQVERSNRLWNEVQAEVARFASWRDEVEPVIRTVQSKVENVRAFIEEVPERIRDALAPMAESISSIDSDLAELSAACNPPLLLTPGGLQSEGDEQSSEGGATQPGASRGGSHDDPFGASSFGYSAS